MLHCVTLCYIMLHMLVSVHVAFRHPCFCRLDDFLQVQVRFALEFLCNLLRNPQVTRHFNQQNITKPRSLCRKYRLGQVALQ